MPDLSKCIQDVTKTYFRSKQIYSGCVQNSQKMDYDVKLSYCCLKGFKIVLKLFWALDNQIFTKAAHKQ